MKSTYHRVCGLMLACLAMAAVAIAPASGQSADLVISGAGLGHGAGMSQEGALGFAERGWSYRAILSHYYSGTAIAQAPAGARVRVLIGSQVHSIALESYVRGVVASEMPASWPAAALEAQAVASRTYALTSHAGGSRFDVYADTRSQVYGGAAARTPQTDAAVAATAGEVVTYEGAPATTYFFASSGGRTENVENAFIGSQPEPWLRSVSDPFDQGQLHSWRRTISFTAATARLRGLVRGSFRGIEVLTRGVSPRILSANVLGSAGPTPISGPDLAARLGLYDTWAFFSVRSGSSVRAEPDRSGRSAAPTPAGSAPVTAAPSTPPASGPEGGVQAQGGGDVPLASAAASGGTAAPN